MTEIQDVPAGRLHPHPDNPRLQLREDVIERLAAEIERGGFGREHAPLVRPYGDGYQIVSGHHRIEAATRVGLDTVPCWVKDMDDDEAFMQLVLGNTQGELSPLEYGKHLASYVKRGVGGRGQEGGLREYARRLAMEDEKAKSSVELLRRQKAYGVYENCYDIVAVSGATPPGHNHLYEISKAPRETWPVLVDALINKGWSVKDVADHVKTIRELNVPERHHFWLDPAAVVAEYLKNPRFDQGKVSQIVRAADSALDWITQNAEATDEAEFLNWLSRQGSEAWNARKIDAWLVDLIGRVRERRLAPEVRAGDFREALADLPDGSVDLILTDPPYGDAAVPSYKHLAEFAARKLKPGGSLVCYTGQSILPYVYSALSGHLRYWWTFSLDHNHGGQQLPGKWVMVEWKPLVWYVRDHRDGQSYVADKVRGSKPDKDAHEWAQGIDEVFYLIEQLTRPDDLIVDPFAGSGAFGKAALSLGRRFIGADLEPGSGTGEIVT